MGFMYNNEKRFKETGTPEIYSESCKATSEVYG